MTNPVITVVGSFAVGMTLRTQRMPVFGETLVGSDFDMGPGGKGSNQAVGVARLGAQAHFAGIIGADKLGEIATDLYAREGVDTTWLQQTTAMATGVGFIILNAEGENGIILDMGANELMDSAFVDQVEEQIARSDVVMSVLEIPVVAAAQAMALGKKHGVRTILNPAPGQPLDPNILANVDLLTPNESETRILLGLAPDDPTPTLDLTDRLLDLGVGTIIVTRGEKGAVIVTAAGTEEIPAVPVQALDVTGAGDSFNAALAVALGKGEDIGSAVEQANRAGAYTTTHLGVIDGLPTTPELENFTG